jgi:hypothetical protein
VDLRIARKRSELSLDRRENTCHLIGGPGEIVWREDPERNRADLERGAPVEYIIELLCAKFINRPRVRDANGPAVPTIAV